MSIEESKTRRKSQTPKKKNKGKHKKKIIRVVIYITLAIFMLSLLFLLGLGIYKLSTSPKYNLSTVTFEGNVKYGYDELMDSLKLSEGVNLFKLSKKVVRENLETLPYINKVKVSKKYPDTLVVKITEYEADYFAYNKETNKYVKLTRDGIILEECSSEARYDNELIIFGINFDDKLEKEIVEVEKTKLSNYMVIKEKYEQTNIDKEITSVEFKEGNVILTLDQDINVILNMNELEYKLSLLKSILNEISGKAGTIDMTIVNPIFRETIK